MTFQERLVSFIEYKTTELGKELNGQLCGNTSILKSGLLDSLALLELASWIEQEIGSPLDLTGVDVVDEFDTIENIVRFVTKLHPGVAA